MSYKLSLIPPFFKSNGPLTDNEKALKAIEEKGITVGCVVKYIGTSFEPSNFFIVKEILNHGWTGYLIQLQGNIAISPENLEVVGKFVKIVNDKVTFKWEVK